MSSPFLPESEALTLGLNGPASAPSPSSSATPPASTGFRSIGRPSRSTGTSTPSQASLFADLWTSSAEDSHASRSASPGSRKGPKTSGTSGPKCHESSEKSDPVGYSLRTYLASELSRLTSSSKTWKDRGTPAGRSWWVLTTSEGRTAARGCGLSEGSDWPTPTAHESETRTNCGGSNGRVGPERPMLAGAARLWPTATAGDAKGSGAAGYSTESGRHSGTTLTDAAADGSRGSLTHMRGNPTLLGKATWPTPRAEDSEQTGAHGGKADTLTSASRLWACPQARDWKDSGPTQGNRKSPNLGTQCAGLPDQESHSTHGKPQDCPTPTAHDGRRPGVDIHSTQGGNLSRDVAMEWPTPRANRHGAPDSHGKAPIRGSLNPRWVAQLQGFPVDWLDSPPPIAAKPSRRLVTPSRRRARTTSAGRSDQSKKGSKR